MNDDHDPRRYGGRTGRAEIGPRYQPRSLLEQRSGGASGAYLPTGSPPAQAQKSGGGKKDILCAFGIDVDAVAGWLGSYGGEDSPCDISRGIFSGEIGSPRLA